MPALVQICIVIVTIGVFAIALMAVRTMTRFNKAIEDLSLLTHQVRGSVVKFDLVTHETEALVAALRECVPPMMRVAGRFDAVSQRAADLSSTLLEAFEIPVLATTAVARGVRSGANHFLKRIVNRLIHRNSPIHGGYDNE